MKILDVLSALGVKGYPPHDARVDEGEAEIGHQGDRPVETLKKTGGESQREPEGQQRSKVTLDKLLFR